ncbi:MAG TPA: DUF4249 domain-containing protein [Candidatus Acidoferrales bacterium]|nr:DUF4249 domain-containing protein [Candidatus Acidoferrales bacterium]
MTRRHDRILFLLLLLFSLSSCQKVISIDLNQTSPQIVIEGLVNDQGGMDSVVINMTGDYFTPSLYFQPITNATVVISDNAGDVDTLRQDSANGVYYSLRPDGAPGITYSLKVIANGKEYDAVSTMPRKVDIDSFYAQPSASLFGESGYDFYVVFKDPPQSGNYYRIIPHVNSIPPDSIRGGRGGIFIADDEFTNGNEITFRFGIRTDRNDNSAKIGPGDTVKVDLLSIDKATYDYLYTLRNVIAADQSPTSLSPANPNTNLTNGSVGYFSAYAMDSRTIILR